MIHEVLVAIQLNAVTSGNLFTTEKTLSLYEVVHSCV